MTYFDVVNIVGEPTVENNAESIKTCFWKIKPLRDWSIEHIITFKDNKVILIQKN